MPFEREFMLDGEISKRYNILLFALNSNRADTAVATQRNRFRDVLDKIIHLFRKCCRSAKGLDVRKLFMLASLLFVAALTLASPATAYDNFGMYGMGVGMGGGWGGYGWGGSQGGIGGIYDGQANVIRSEGMYNQMNSQAAINYQKANQENEKARALHLENQQKIHEEKLKRTREAKVRQSEERVETMAARERQQQFMDAHRPQPLAGSQLDPSTGRINWPSPLMTSEFDDFRKAVEAFFETQMKYGSTSDLTIQIVRKVGEMKDLLRKQILNMPMPEYSESRKFLDSLAASAR
jgi:hypothetical protein